MNAHDYDRLKYHGVGIPEDAYDAAGLNRVLEALVACERVRTITQNQTEIDRLRGTPGEPIPLCTLEIFCGVRFADDFRGDRSATILTRQSQTVREMQDCGMPFGSMVVDNILSLSRSPEHPTRLVVTKNREQLNMLLTYQGSDFAFEEKADNARHARAGE